MPSAANPTIILIADDYPDAAEVLGEVLSLASPAPIEVSIALDGTRAVALAIALRPAMAILDIEMPGMDGLEAATAIRAALGADAPLLVAITGNAVRAADPQTVQAFDVRLPKPPPLDKLLQLIATRG